MGTTELAGLNQEEYGIVPRVINFVFEEIEKRKHKAEFVVKCTFLEIYNEELHDLLDPTTCMTTESMTQYMIQKNQKEITIREEKEGQIAVYGLQEEKIESPDDLFSCLERGSNFRSTSSTLMNACSSRSHAIFTITIEQHIIEDLYKNDEIPKDAKGNPSKLKEDDPTTREEFMVAKFHFVDLAGSERLKKTGATGTTMKEGISINKGLLSLGNVISALTDDKNKVFHVPYRDSKLTRILQDSLGGNSRTTMIACVSPAEYNYEESLNTLKYAARARNIKNKPIVNRDPNSALIAQLRQNVYELQRDIIMYKKTLLSNEIELPKDMAISNEEVQMEFGSRDLRSKGTPMSPVKRIPSGNGTPSGTMLSGREIMEFEYQIKDLKIEVSKKDKSIRQLEVELDLAREENDDTNVKYFACQRERDLLKIKCERLEGIIKSAGLWDEAEMEKNDELEENNEIKLVEEYHEKIEEYKKIADDKEKLCRNLRSENEALSKKSKEDSDLLQDKVLLCEKLKRDLKNLEKENIKLQKKIKMSPTEAHSLRMKAAREGRSGYISQKEQRSNDLKTIMKHGSKIKKHQEWMSKELGNTIENFNEMFLNNLSLSLNQIFVAKDRQNQQQNEPKHEDAELDEEDEEEEEEGDTVFEVEVVNQNALDQEKSDKVDPDAQIETTYEEEKEFDQVEEPEEINPENIQDAIYDNNDAKVKDKEMQDQLNEQEKAVIKIEGSLHEREKLLEAVKESHSLMQKSLLEEMKKEYFKKVKEMEYEINKLKADHKLSLRGATTASAKSSMEEQHKKKMSELEDKLKLYKVKEKEQKKLERECLKQTNKIKVLENDIEKIRNQKITLNRKLKEYDEKYKKWKVAKGTELLNAKKLGVKKDREINQLRREKRRNEMLAQRKIAEVNLLKKRHKDEELTRKKEEIQRRKNMKQSSRKKRFGPMRHKKQLEKQKKVPKEEPSLPVDIEKVRQWIEANVEKIVTIKHLEKDLATYEEKKQTIESEIEEEQKYYSEISINKEKALLKKSKLKPDVDEGEALITEQEIEEYDAILKKNQENIESLEDKIEFYNKKIINIENAIEQVNHEEIKGLNLDNVSSVQNAKTLLLAFFNIVLEVKVKRIELEDTLIEQHNSIKEMEHELKVLRDSKKTAEVEFTKALQKREKEYQELESKLMQEAEARVDESKLPINTTTGLTNLEAKRLERKKNDKNSSTEAYEDSKRKLSKMMSQLERKLVLEEKRNLSMATLIEQSKAEKEQYKQRYQNLKKKIMQEECDQLRMHKMASLEPQPYSTGDNTGTPANKLSDYRDMRKDRKIVKKGLNEQAAQNINQTEGGNIGSQEGVSKDRKGAMAKMRGSISMDPTNTNVFDRLLSHSTITSRIKEKPPVTGNEEGQIGYNQSKERSSSFNIELEGIEDSDLLWNCEISVENAHANPIYSIATMENQLYTCSKKSLKIWDIDTMNSISDIAAHTGVIKSLCVLPEQKLLASASDKVIMLWDLVSLTNVATLKAHHEEINVLQKGFNILVSAGASGFNNNALYVWDLRMSTPVEEREKSDIL